MAVENLDSFLILLNTSDTKKKISVGASISDYLSNPESSLECEDIGRFVDGVVLWLHNSNFKVCQNGLDVLAFLVERMGDDFRTYLGSALPGIVDRLGDSKEVVRDKAESLLLKIMEHTIPPQTLFDKFTALNSFNHKNAKIREEIMLMLQTTLSQYGSSALLVSRLVPLIVKLLSDPTPAVRECAINTVVEIYRHVGERLRTDIQKNHNLPPAKLQSLLQKFDEVRDSGDMLPTAVMKVPLLKSEDNVDSSKANGKRANSAPPNKRQGFIVPKAPSGSSMSSSASRGVKRSQSMRRTGAVTAGTGGVDEDAFMQAFEDVPRIQLFSGREVDEHFNVFRETVGDSSKDWDKRVDALKKMRSVLIAGAINYDEFGTNLRSVESSFQISVKDLRSQVVRESCITIAFLAQLLGNRLDHFSETLLPSLINLINNSAKVVSTSGIVAIRFIIQHVHSYRLIPILTIQLSSKAPIIRRAACEFLDQLLHTWPTHTLEKHVNLIQEAVKKGIMDADSEARVFSRKAYWGFVDHFKDQAEALLSSLEAPYKRLLGGEVMSSSCMGSLSRNVSRSRGSSAAGSQESLHRIPTTTLRRGVSTTDSGDGLHGSSRLTSPALRSNSAIDLAAAQRARARAEYAAKQRGGQFTSKLSLPRPRKASESTLIAERNSRTRSRSGGVSQSQPSSRSGSPSSRLSYATYSPIGDSATIGRTRKKSGIPRSTGTSRETSPNRFGISRTSRSRSITGTGSLDRTIISPSTPLMAQKILQQSMEAEKQLAVALNITPRRKTGVSAFDDHSDESETSSVCSEMSYDSFKKSEKYQEWDPNAQYDVGQMIAACNNSHWGERKDGLNELQCLLRSHRTLTATELKKVTDSFTRMFMDPHTKVFNIFLDTLNVLISVHKEDLESWLYVLITRLLNKFGADLLPSVQQRINKTLDLIRESFPLSHQFSVVMRFLSDPIQTPNTKVKLATLSFTRQLLACMSLQDFGFSTGSEKKSGLNKLASWVQDAKSAEVQKSARQTLFTLYEVNPSECTLLLSQVPASQQVHKLFDMRSHHEGPFSYVKSSPSSPLSPTMYGNHSPHPIDENSENLNPEEVYRCLRKTTAEIQSYSYDKLDSTSKDSGISQMSVPGDDKDIRRDNGLLDKISTSPVPLKNHNKGDLHLFKDKNGHENISADQVLVELAKVSLRKSALCQLLRLCQERRADTLHTDFKLLLRLLFESLNDFNSNVRTLVFEAFTELLAVPSLNQEFVQFTELLILKVLEGHKDSVKDVVRAAEACAATVSGYLPAEDVVRVLNPIIQTGEYPINQAAIKMLTRLVEHQEQEVVHNLLGIIMPGLIQAYDNEESSVRKSAVFCMVALHNVVGSSLQPHLEVLNGSKLKLLNLYIKRAQSQQSTSHTPSPRLSPSGSK